MKPVNINLVVRKNVWTKVSLALVVLLALTTSALTLVNTYDYFANTKVIKTYETRIKTIKQRSEQKRSNAEKKTPRFEETEQYQKDVAFFSEFIEKNIFPLPRVLTEIEKAKPDKVNINALIFSKNLKTIKIKGESGYVNAVSRFIIDLSKSKYFEVELSKEEIKANKKIVFELTATWSDEKTKWSGVKTKGSNVKNG